MAKATGGAPPEGSGRSWTLPTLSWRRGALVALLALQLACAAFFVYDILGGILGIRTQPLSWMAHELSQIGAIAGLIFGVVVSAVVLSRSDKRRQAAEDRLAEVSRALHEMMEERFSEWSLTPAERDVASFVMKGFSTQEISGLRETSEGTVKAQTAAIYRKAGVSGRAQLVSLFLEDLMDEGITAKAKAANP